VKREELAGEIHQPRSIQADKLVAPHTGPADTDVPANGEDYTLRRAPISKKVEANRRNAQKSTGPKTRDGKRRSRYNAVRHGAFVRACLLPGESRQALKKLAAQVASEARPRTAVENMLVEQIVGDLWRLRRVELAEQAFFEEIRLANLSRAKRISERDTPKVRPHAFESQQSSERGIASNEPVSGVAASRRIDIELKCAQFVRDETIGKLALDGMVDPGRAFPFSTLQQIRATLVRSILKKNMAVVALCDRRPRLRISGEALRREFAFLED